MVSGVFPDIGNYRSLVNGTQTILVCWIPHYTFMVCATVDRQMNVAVLQTLRFNHPKKQKGEKNFPQNKNQKRSVVSTPILPPNICTTMAQIYFP